jgi:prolyl-tRNA synthetase
LLISSSWASPPHHPGDRGLKDGKAEYQGRRDTGPTPVPVADIAGFVKDKLDR